VEYAGDVGSELTRVLRLELAAVHGDSTQGVVLPGVGHVSQNAAV
jgi:hypothetical protein